MTTLESRWQAWQPSSSTTTSTPSPTPIPDDRSPEPDMSRDATDKTDRSPQNTERGPFGSFVSPVSGLADAEGDRGAGASDGGREYPSPSSNCDDGVTVRPSGAPKLDTPRDGVPEEWHRGVCTLINLPCPAGVLPARWRRLKLDGAKFFEQLAPRSRTMTGGAAL